MDREQAALEEGIDRGLGLMDGQWHGKANWFGGRIQQIARVIKGDGKKEADWRTELEPMEMKRSHRLGRELGSRRILQVKIGKDLFEGGVTGIRTIIPFLSRKALCVSASNVQNMLVEVIDQTSHLSRPMRHRF